MVIELNQGLFYELACHYKTVEAMGNVSDALVVMSNKFGRPSKIGLILYNYFFRYNECVSRKPESYLNSLEMAIFRIQLDIARLVKDFIGFFGEHPLATLQLYSKDNYGEFIALCNHKRLVGSSIINEFWVNEESVKAINTIINKLQSKAKKSKLVKAERELLQFLSSLANDNKILKYNKHMGDLIIAIECPRGHILLTKDKIFKTIVPLIDKKFKMWSADSPLVAIA